jgi:hypothetical protein
MAPGIGPASHENYTRKQAIAQRSMGVILRSVGYVTLVRYFVPPFFRSKQRLSAGYPPVVWHHTALRETVSTPMAEGGAGYFTFIGGIPRPSFAGPLLPSEATAFFTFTTARFSTVLIPNGNVNALLHPPCQLLSPILCLG